METNIVKTLVEIRGGRVSVQETDNETRVTITHGLGRTSPLAADRENLITELDKAVEENHRLKGELIKSQQAMLLTPSGGRLTPQIQQLTDQISDQETANKVQQTEILRLHRQMADAGLEATIAQQASYIRELTAQRDGFDQDRKTERHLAGKAAAVADNARWERKAALERADALLKEAIRLRDRLGEIQTIVNHTDVSNALKYGTHAYLETLSNAVQDVRVALAFKE